MATPNPARLSAIGSKTLTLAMERQRLLSISPPSGSPIGQITKNMTTLRDGIVAIETAQGSSSQTESLREQYSSILGVLGEEEVAAAGLPSMPPPPQNPAKSLLPAPSSPPRTSSPFRDDPEQSNGDMYLQQKQIMQDQDTQLDTLSHSIGRQHHLSLQINDELGEQAGLLDGLDEDLDRTGMRLSRAQRALDKVSKGTKDNCSAVTIAIVICILLLLIIIFKT
ncbi:hypothetical protein CPB86DRAFT_851065 [Serendipita vermifera]|nr:hypothetical protein CPB86DRAFT_851065 [Serendipita vermifera]